MTKVGLKETLSLLAAGYKKTDIEALAAIDEEHEQEENSKHEKQEKEVPVEEKKEEEPDYKAMYEELLKKNKKTEATVTKLQQDNVHKDMAPAAADAIQKQQESLTSLVRSFM